MQEFRPGKRWNSCRFGRRGQARYAYGMTDITRILSQIQSGDPKAAEELLPHVYRELRQLAASRMAHEKPGQTLQATALVHEAYLRLVKDQDQDAAWDSRGHFFASAAEAMRRVLIDRARKKNRVKHGAEWERADLDIDCPANNESPDRLLAIDEALENLESEHPDVAKLLKLRYFAGLSLEASASLLQISQATAKRRWTLARAFLYNQLSDT